jgi:serine phosphatase RsbU (regulator of sigma subunit)
LHFSGILLDRELFRTIPIFNSLPPEEVEALDKITRERHLLPGEVLYKEGQSDDNISIILDGQVEIIKSMGTQDERVLAVRNPGAIIGEMGLLDQQHFHTATVRALGHVAVLQMQLQDYDALLRRQPGLTYEMARTLSTRMAEGENRTIADLREKNRRLTEAYKQLQAAQAELVEKAKLERELSVARNIQKEILPNSLPVLPGYDFGALMTPAMAIGGDFYDFIRLDQDHLAVIVGDVSGKGVPSALYMAVTYSLLRAEAHHKKSPIQMLRTVNRLLLEIQVTDLYVTICFLELALATGSVRCVRAGHPQPILIKASGDYLDRPIVAGQPLGLIADPALDECSFQLEHGDGLLLHSDGATDAIDAEGIDYGMARLRRSLSANYTKKSQLLCEAIWEDIDRFGGSSVPVDDTTLVFVKRAI